MFLLQYARGQRFLGITRYNLNSRLYNDRTPICFGGDKMHCASMHLHTFLQRLPMGMQTGKSGQQRGMNVYQPAFIAADKTAPQQAHETGQGDEIRCVGIDDLCKFLVKHLAIRV